MWPDFLLFPCSKRGALEHPKFLPTVVLSLGVIFQDYLHQLLTCIKVIRAQSDDTCNPWTPVGEFILNPGNNLLHVALNKVLYVPFSEKEINSTEDYASSLAGHICCYHFFHYQCFLSPLEHSLLRNIHAIQNQIRNPLRTIPYFVLHLFSTWPSKNGWPQLWQITLLQTQK